MLWLGNCLNNLFAAKPEQRRLRNFYETYTENCWYRRHLNKTESLLYYALEINGFGVHLSRHGFRRWEGVAYFDVGQHQLVIETSGPSRQQSLWNLWSAASGQEGERPTLSEAHLQGSLFQTLQVRTKTLITK